MPLSMSNLVTSTWAITTASPRAEGLGELCTPEAQTTCRVLRLGGLPWRLQRPPADETARCELLINLHDAPLRCKGLEIRLTSTARHIELYVDGIRRNLLGEDEHSEVYFGTIRGRPKGTSTEDQHEFEASGVYDQRQGDYDVLKCIHTIRIKFVSLTGDKTALDVSELDCRFLDVADEKPRAQQSPAMSDLVGMVAGMSIPGQAPGLNPQMLLMTMQHMLEQQVETKIAQVLDAKLSVLSQRLAFAEQMLLRVRDKTEARDTQLGQRMDELQHQVDELRRQLPALPMPSHELSGTVQDETKPNEI